MTTPTAPTDLALTAADGRTLAASRFDPPGAVARALVIAGAMGVPQRFYAALARDFSQRGIGVVTFDYRGIGRSLHGALRDEPARLATWGELDLDAALATARAAWPDAPLAVFGHSVGGQLAGMAASFAHVDRMVTVASQSGYWRLWPGIGAPVMWTTWHVVIPALTHVAGFLPFRAVNMGENVPRGVALDWSRSGRLPGYIWDFHRDRPSLEGYRTWRGALRAIDISDDTFAPARSVDGLVAHYPAARVTRESLVPAAAGVKAIGHFGAFREAVGGAKALDSRLRGNDQPKGLWTQWADWLVTA